MSKLKFECINIIKLGLVTVSLLLMSGCGVTMMSHRDTNPVIRDYSGNWVRNLFGADMISTFSTTASRRVVLLLDEKDKMLICSEPSPDIGEAFASAIADGIKASAKYKGVTADISNQYARAVSTQIAPLVYRTQGLQLYRDAMHGLCVDRLNGWVSNVDYEKARAENLKAAVLLIT
jgi:hypothetical protein